MEWSDNLNYILYYIYYNIYNIIYNYRVSFSENENSNCELVNCEPIGFLRGHLPFDRLRNRRKVVNYGNKGCLFALLVMPTYVISNRELYI